MAIGRATSGWRLEAVLFGGILLAVALMASGVIFSELLSNAALRDALDRSETKRVNFTVRSFTSGDDPLDAEGRKAAFGARDQFVLRNVQQPIEPFLKDHSRFIKASTFFFQGHPHLELEREIRPRGPLVHLTGLDGRIRVLDGQWPTGTGPPGEPVRVAVDELGAQLLEMGIGDTMEVFPATLFDDSRPITVQIAAIFEVLDPSDDFWYGLSAASSRKDDRWTLVPLFASEEDLLGQVLGAYPSIYVDTTWYFYTDPESMPASQIVEVQRLLNQIERTVTVGLVNASYYIQLDNLLREFEQELLLASLPLLLMLLLVVAILTYYLALMAGLIVRSRRSEITLLKSRGATAPQIAILALAEGLVVATPAVIAGPYVALGLIKLLGFLFFRLSGASGEPLSVAVGISQFAFILGIAGGVLAVAVFTVATYLASRQGGAEARQTGSSPPTSNFFHRYYLDFALLALIGLVWWQLQSRGTFLVQSLGSRELAIDYTLLLGPVLGLVASGLIVLRVFPWATGVLARIAGPGGPLLDPPRAAARLPRSADTGHAHRAGHACDCPGGHGQLFLGDSGAGETRSSPLRGRGRSACPADEPGPGHRRRRRGGGTGWDRGGVGRFSYFGIHHHQRFQYFQRTAGGAGRCHIGYGLAARGLCSGTDCRGPVGRPGSGRPGLRADERFRRDSIARRRHGPESLGQAGWNDTLSAGVGPAGGLPGPDH